jgi:phosphatidate cytidylyltransferase
MALNLRSLGVRSLSSVVFVVVLLSCLLWNYYSFTLFFFVMSLIALNEFYKMCILNGAVPFRITGFILGAITYMVFFDSITFTGVGFNTRLFQPALLLVPFILLVPAIITKRERPFYSYLFTLSGIIYAVLPFALLHELVLVPDLFGKGNNYYPLLLLGVILLIWSNDTFAYLGGSLFGKHKMIGRISPGKTWEGTLFGIAITFGLSFLIRRYLFESSDSIMWPVLGIVVPILATTGDLIESMLKRQAGVKDSGSLMPGHGGVLDRFDSLIFISPFLVVFLRLLDFH